jgi:hypothetical protein
MNYSILETVITSLTQRVVSSTYIQSPSWRTTSYRPCSTEAIRHFFTLTQLLLLRSAPPPQTASYIAQRFPTLFTVCLHGLNFEPEKGGSMFLPKRRISIILRGYIPADGRLHNHRCKDLKSIMDMSAFSFCFWFLAISWSPTHGLLQIWRGVMKYEPLHKGHCVYVINSCSLYSEGPRFIFRIGVGSRIFVVASFPSEGLRIALWNKLKLFPSTSIPIHHLN